MPLPIERYLCNFILETPEPTQDYLEVVYMLENTFFEFKRNPLENPFVSTDLPYDVLIQCLGKKTH